MNLRDQAADDFKSICHDTSGGFGWDVEIESPTGVIQQFCGLSTDVSQTIDPETGVLVAGRRASVSIPFNDLTVTGFSIPVNIDSRAAKPWIVRFKDIECIDHQFKVIETMPDRALGSVVLMLSVYKTT